MDSLLELKNDRFVIVDYTIILIIAIVHFVFGFYIRKTDFQNIFDSFESSPLFDFSIGTTCDSNSHIIFHTWEGREEKYYYYKYGHYVSDTRKKVRKGWPGFHLFFPLPFIPEKM